jgi:cystathionine beta-synthase
VLTSRSPRVCGSVLEAVGETPLVELSRLGQGVRTPIVAKVESLNPGGSIKDRVGLAMIEAAERAGELRPGATIVEPTSGNTGVGIAIAACVKGYRMIAVTKDKTSDDKVALLRAYGAEVVVTPSSAPPDSPDSCYSVAERLAEEIPGAFRPNQYENLANPEIHYLTTGPELWRQCEGMLTHLVVGIGTGGTVSGVGRYLLEQDPDIEVIGVDPVGSIYTSDRLRPWLVEGVGQDMWPETIDMDVVTRVVNVSDVEAFETARRLTATEGILAGGSSGLAVCAALEIAEELDDPHAVVAVILPDGGRSYLSTVYNDRWLLERGIYLESASTDTQPGFADGDGLVCPPPLVEWRVYA